jgi:capsular polysaccharide biosynthesis protein
MLVGIGVFLLTFATALGSAIVYMITQLHKIDKKVKSPEEINDMIDLKMFKHIEKCRADKKDRQNG